MAEISVSQLSALDIQWSMAEQNNTEYTKTTVLHGKAAQGTLFNALTLDNLREERLGDYGFYSGHQVRYGYGRQYDEIDITCIELTVPYVNLGYWSRFEAVNRTESRPLEEKTIQIGANDEVYAIWWNHEVRGTGGALTTLQKDNLKAKTTLEGGTGITGTYWAKSNQALKSGESVFLDARYPSVQSFGVGAEQVKEIIFARDIKVVQSLINTVGYLRYPKDHGGNNYDENTVVAAQSGRTDDENWLITNVSYRKRFGWYEAERTYAYAKGGWLAQQAVAPLTGVYPVATV